MIFDKLIKFSVITILLGRGYQHLNWDGPYRALFWDENLLSPLVSLLGFEWKEYVTSPYLDLSINLFTKLIGVILIISALSATKYFRSASSVFLLRLSSTLLFFMSLLLFKDKHFQLPMLIENSIQFGLPMFYSFNLWKPFWSAKQQFILKILIALTFVGHGTYAMGLGVPVPSNFVEMVMEILYLDENTARIFLKFAGMFDYMASISLFVPILSKNALIFMSLWGMSTAFARVVAYVEINTFISDLHSWGFETVFRFGHGLAPLSMLVFMSTFEFKDLAFVKKFKEYKYV